ncbi:MAG: nitrate reductase [Candidatus Sumerlaeia bacterium]|nr:nitrate reductase [Candidatus Sumerlaeia bacterium]
MFTSRLLWLGLFAAALSVVFLIGALQLRPEGFQRGPAGTRIAFTGGGGACVECHARTSPGIVEQHARSAHAVEGVTCQDCHEVREDHFAAVEHYGTFVATTPTSATCAQCHLTEVNQFLRSRHALPAWVAMTGVEALENSPEFMALYEQVEERGILDPVRNSLFAMEGPEITRFACAECHGIGRPNPDGSVGNCTSCHLRHEYSLEQARKPETCNACHIGPDHPQFEIYEESPHGIAYATMGHTWHWEAEPGTLTVSDFPAATCAICHISGFGRQGTTHDVGERLSWFLHSEISERRPGWQENAMRMQQVCHECHSQRFVSDFYRDADILTVRINEMVEESQTLMAELQEEGHLTPEPFDQIIDFEYFELWHHWGRTAKFGAWMQGPDYTQWHGVYEMIRSAAHLVEAATELRGHHAPAAASGEAMR